ncbi:MAG: DEAD/DEAH box helicase [Thermoproteota archaeon]|nr:DEAD/DEAH box helicase [Thermoproteota archaeon]
MAAISNLRFPFELKDDQLEAVEAWLLNNCVGSVIFSTGTGKTEIAFECARRMADIVLARDRSSTFLSTERKINLKLFTILFLVPRIVLISQNVERLIKYGLSAEHIGIYFGERKDIREITISTYQSVVNNLDLIRKADLIILDEIHLISETASEYSKIFAVIAEDPNKGVLGLTATIDDADPKNSTIMRIAPPVKKYMIRDAVNDGRLAKPQIIPLMVKFTTHEQAIYDDTSRRIRELSRKLGQFNPGIISMMLANGGYRAKLAKSWFENVRKRKELLSTAINKLYEVIKIVKEHPHEPIMIFSETISSIKQLEEMLTANGIKANVIHNEISISKRKEILKRWGKEFYPLLSVHTLEIGYDIPHVRIAIIIANSSNVNQITQRIGRVIRKSIGKNDALIYIVYVKDTKDNNILKIVKSTINMDESKTQLKLPSHSGQRRMSEFYG